MIIGHQKQWDFLKRKFEQNQLAHAYLFTGADQIGKRTFAKEFVKMINCKSINGKPCLKCVNCQMIEKGSYPDLFLINSGGAEEITISKIREAQNFLSYKSYYGSLKFVIVNEAEKMNTEAQSCFLKTLEEPKGQTLIILVSSKPEMLLPTIYSRCQSIKFFRPKDLSPNIEKQAKEQIILLELKKVINSDFSEKFKYVKSIDFEKQKIGEITEVMQKYFRKLLLAKIGIDKSKEADNYNVSNIKKIINLIEDINFQTLFTNASPKLALEILLMEI